MVEIQSVPRLMTASNATVSSARLRGASDYQREMMRLFAAREATGLTASLFGLVLIGLFATDHPNGLALFAPIMLLLATLWSNRNATLSLCRQLDRRAGFDRERRQLELGALCGGAAWGLMLWPVADGLGNNLAAVFILIVLIVAITLLTFTTALVPKLMYAAVIGFALVTIPKAILLYATMGAVPLIALLSAGPVLAFVGGDFARQTGQAIAVQLENAALTRQLEAALAQSEHLSHHDALTGLLNRRAFEQRIETLYHRHRHSLSLAVMVIDLDHFKAINDRFGHHAGDTVLRSTALALTSFLEEDQQTAQWRDFTARWGGEEFVIALPCCTLETAQAMAELLRLKIDRLIVPAAPAELQLSASFGVAAWMANETLESVIARADHALYRAKENGRNCVCVARS